MRFLRRALGATLHDSVWGTLAGGGVGRGAKPPALSASGCRVLDWKLIRVGGGLDFEGVVDGGYVLVLAYGGR